MTNELEVTNTHQWKKPTVGDLNLAVDFAGSYRGIAFSIRCWTFAKPSEASEDKKRWNFYLYLRQPQFNAGVWDEMWLEGRKSSFSDYIVYDYECAAYLSGINFHCGITFYEKQGGHDGKDQVLKIGCDYSHLYDEGLTYTTETVLQDVINAIDSLHELVPDIKYWCQGNGGYYFSHEGTLGPDGKTFHSYMWQATCEDKLRG